MIQSWQNLTNITNKLYHLSSYSLIKIYGDDSETFLQGQFTADIHKIDLNTSTLSCYVNTKGRIDAIIRVLKIANNEYILKLPSELATTIINELRKYAMISKVEIKPIRADKYITFGFNLTNDIMTDEYKNTKYNSVLAHKGCYVIRVNDKSNNINAFEVIAKKDSAQKLWQDLCEVIEPESEKEAQDLYILSKIPEVYKSTYREFLPHNIGLVDLDAVSFTKGCFRGQEIIARMQHRGNIKNGLKIIKCEKTTELSQSDITSGHDVYSKNDENFKSIGKIVRSNLTQQGQLLILAQLPLEFEGIFFVKSSRDDAYVEITPHL